MAGDPLPWDLQEQIALIPNEIWEAGPEAVAEEIARIEAAFYGPPIDERAIDAAAASLVADPLIFAEVYASQAAHIAHCVAEFERKADLNGDEHYGFGGFVRVAKTFTHLSDILAASSAKDLEIAELKAEVRALDRVIRELRREFRDTRQMYLDGARPASASRLSVIGAAALALFTVGGAVGSMAGGYFAAFPVDATSCELFGDVRREAAELAEVMRNLDEPLGKPNKKR